jgi:two-component system sensor histidine kinase RegB
MSPLPWLVRLRWLGVVGEVTAILAARFVLELALAWPAMVGVTVLTLLSNVALALFARGLPAEARTSRVMGSVLALDTLSLTVLLAASGGPMNPFTVLYLVHITLASVVLGARWTSAIAALSVLGFGLLFLGPQDPHVLHRATSLKQHLQGMWIAFVLATGLTAFFVRRSTEAIRRQHEAIARLREANERQARLASLTTLAAGAAHELGTPLGTIAVAAHEAAAAAQRLAGARAIAEDLRLIELEVERCRKILVQMAAKATHTPGEEVALTLAELPAEVEAQLEPSHAGRLEVRYRAATEDLTRTSSELPRAVAALVRNGLDASPSAPVVLDISTSREELEIRVEDRAGGIPPELLGRIGEPFFTTKEPGHGLGLGVFLVRTFAESQGGALEIDSDRTGTRAKLSLPLRRREQA